MKLKRPLFLSWIVSVACSAPHVCGPACESQRPEVAPAAVAPAAALAPSGARPAQARPAEVQDAGGALTPEQALASFDEAWQTVHDTHFDKTFNGVDWDALKAELRPKAAEAKTRDDVRAVISEMLGRLNQSHFAVIPSDALPDAGGGTSQDRKGTLGFDVRLRDGKLLVVRVDAGGPAARAGVALGWGVRSVGRFDTGEVLERAQSAGEAVGERTLAMHTWMAVQGRLFGPLGEKVHAVLVNGKDEPVELDLERGPRDAIAFNAGPTLPPFYLEFASSVLERDGKRIGYVRFSNWFLPMMQKLNDALDGMRGLDGVVIDLRGNTGGAAAMTMGVAGHFFAENTRLGVMTTRDSTLNILAVPRGTNAAGEPLGPITSPFAIVVDETTGSASEVFAGGLQSVKRAQVFGETTAGAVLPAMTTKLPNGDSLLHAMGDFETADGTRLEGTGVVPDHVVTRRREDLLAGRDAPLEAALAWIVAPH